ncbi:MAG: ABC transporter permease [Ilumatobacteraceae bacterium]
MSAVAAIATPLSRRQRGRQSAAGALPTLAVGAGSLAVFLVLVLWFTSVGAGEALSTFGRGAFGGVDPISETLTRAVPLAIIGVGAGVALRAGVFNVGGESQMIAGAVAATLVARWFGGAPAVAVWLLAVLAAVVGGAAWAVVPAVLWVRRGVSEILSTLLINFVTTALLAWVLAKTVLHDPDPTVITPQGRQLPAHLDLPLLIHGSRLHIGFLVAVVAVFATAWTLRTATGFRIDLVGANPRLAAQAGVRPTRLRIEVLLISAAFAGLAGAVQLFGLSHRLTTGLTGGVGYTGLLVAVLGRSKPLVTAVAAVVFAALLTGGEALERAGVPRTLSAVVQMVLIIGVALASVTEARR